MVCLQAHFSLTCHFEIFVETTDNFQQTAAFNEIPNELKAYENMGVGGNPASTFLSHQTQSFLECIESQSCWKFVSIFKQFLVCARFLRCCKSYSPRTMKIAKPPFVNLIIHSWRWKLLHYIYENMITKIYSLSHTKATVKTPLSVCLLCVYDVSVSLHTCRIASFGCSGCVVGCCVSIFWVRVVMFS